MAKRKKPTRKSGGGRRMRGDGWELIAARSEAARNVARIRSEPPQDQKIVVRSERRKDKHVTVARGFQLTKQDLKALAKQLKTACSAGGTAGEDSVEIQGHHLEKVRELLQKQGYQVR